MESPKGPTEAIARLLAEELRSVLGALPENLQESVPDQLKGNRPSKEGSTDPKGSTPPRGS